MRARPASADRVRRPTLGQRRARAIASALFRLIVPNRAWELPRLPGIAAFASTARDGVVVRGWCWRPERATRGTVVICHGLLRNCTMDGIPDWARRLSLARVATCAVDLRFHGRSDDGIPSFGLAESWDVRAALDHCERAGFPRPFVLMGGSLGALAAQRAAYDDARVAGAALLAMPAWPWHGARVGASAVAGLAREEMIRRMPGPLGRLLGALIVGIGRLGRLVGRLVDRAYAGDILAAGDVRRFGPPPAHRPRLLAVIGARDVFDWRASLLAWTRWPDGGAARPGRWPAAAADRRRWFVTVPGRGHPPAPDHLLDWPGLPALIGEFVEVVVGRGEATASDLDVAASRSGHMDPH